MAAVPAVLLYHRRCLFQGMQDFEKEPPQVQDEEVAACTPNSNESGKEKMTEEIAAETNENSEPEGSQTEKS